MPKKDDQILKVIKENKAGIQSGIVAVCTANFYAIEAGLLNAKEKDQYLFIESTSNQVDQFGGYTGLTPDGFRDTVYDIAKRNGYPKNKIIFGGDHLGPNVWQNEKSKTAMMKAKTLIESYVSAGFRKIHIDASMKCLDDNTNDESLDPQIVAERTAELCEISELTYKKNPSVGERPVYIIGSDVPPPGGSKSGHKELRITLPEEVDETIYLTEKAFKKRNLTEALSRIIAVVVQPGVEFGDSDIYEYNHKKALPLVRKIKEKSNLVYEAHSTDYQKKSSLREMIKDHFAILKVGPWLTFSFREAVFALNRIECELLKGNKNFTFSNLEQVVEQQMIADPGAWKKYYNGPDLKPSVSRKYSYSDRIRYYWANKHVQESLNKMINNLTNKTIPLSIISQYLPDEYISLREGQIVNNPKSIILHKIKKVLENYNYALGKDKL